MEVCQMEKKQQTTADDCIFNIHRSEEGQKELPL